MRREKGSEVVSDKRAKAEDKGERHLSRNVMLEWIRKSHVVKVVRNEGGGKANKILKRDSFKKLTMHLEKGRRRGKGVRSEFRKCSDTFWADMVKKPSGERRMIGIVSVKGKGDMCSAVIEFKGKMN